MASRAKTTDSKLPPKLSVADENSSAQAREQATEYESLFGDVRLDLDDGDFIMVPPHPNYGLLDDDKMEEWNQLLFAVDTEYEREPDIYIPGQTLDSGVELPGTTIRGDIKMPYRRIVNGVPELVSPPHTVKIVQIALGMEDYEKMRRGGRTAKDVFKIWGQQSLNVKNRQNNDSFRAGSSVDLASVSETDSE